MKSLSDENDWEASDESDGEADSKPYSAVGFVVFVW